MKFVQLADSLRLDHVVSTVNAFRASAQLLGLESFLCAHDYAEEHGPIVSSRAVLACLDEEDVLMLHMGALSTDNLLDFVTPKCRKMIYYYGGLELANVAFVDPFFRDRCRISYEQLRFLADKTEFGIAATAHDIKVMECMGFDCPLFKCEPVIPSLVTGEDSALRYHREGVKIISVGDVFPSRGYENVLRGFKFYKGAYDPSASLKIIARYLPSDPYFRSMCDYADMLSLCVDDVFPVEGNIEDIFVEADIFLSLSTSEDQLSGFVTAMRQGVPIVALDSDSIEGILEGAYLKVSDSEPVHVARTLRDVMQDEDLRSALIAKGQKRAIAFTDGEAAERMTAILHQMIGGTQ